jgi:hypothetical protein
VPLPASCAKALPACAQGCTTPKGDSNYGTSEDCHNDSNATAHDDHPAAADNDNNDHHVVDAEHAATTATSVPVYFDDTGFAARADSGKSV